MLQHCVQSQNGSFQTVTKVKPRTCCSVHRYQLSRKHAVHPWLGTEPELPHCHLLGPRAQQEKGGMDGPGTCSGRTLCSWSRGDIPGWGAAQSVHAQAPPHPLGLQEWRCGWWLAGLVLLRGLWMLGLIRWAATARPKGSLSCS